MKKFQEHFFLFLLLILEWNNPTLAASPVNLQLSLVNTDGSLQQVTQTLQQYLSGVSMSPGQTVVISVTPPSGSTDGFLQVIMNAAKTVVPQFVPNAGISFKIGARKSGDGTLSNIQLSVIIGEAVGGGSGGDGGGSSNIPASNTRTVKMDLSSGGSNPSGTITQQVSNIVNGLKPQLDSNQPIQIILQITPPKGSTQQYSSNIMSALRTILQQVVPVSMESGVKASMSGYNDGTLASLTITITITPSASENNNNPNGENIQIDLSNPSVNIPDAVRTVLTTVIQNPSVLGDGSKPAQINLQIKPPPATTTTAVQNIIGIIKSILITLVPNAELSIRTSMSQGPNGIVTNINSAITITPSSTNNPNQVTFKMDLSPPGSDIVQQVTNILPNIQHQVKPILDNGEPSTLNLIITPPSGVTDIYVKTITNNIMPVLQKLLPNNMQVTANASKDPQGRISQIILTITIQPDIEVISIDLTTPGSNLVQEITNIVPNLKDKVNKDQPKNKPVTFSLKIQPPQGSNDQTVKDTMNTVLTTLSNIFPENKIGIQARTTKDPLGNITSITLIPTIEPNPNAKEPDNQVTLNVDLTKPGNNLIQEVTNIIPTLKDKVEREQPKNEPVEFNLNIDPPPGSDEDFVKPTINDVLTTLSRIFPNNQIDAKAKTTKDPEGTISDVDITFTIHPNPNPKNPEDVYNLDLNEPGSSIVQEIKNIVPNLKDKVNKEQPKGEPVSFTLNIQPPKGTTDQFVKDAMNNVLTTLSKIFPSNKVGVHAKVSKDTQGNISNINFILTIQPDPNVKPKTPISIDMSLPGSNIVQEITKILPNLKDNVNREKPKGEPASFELNIQPPVGSNEQFVKDLVNDSVTTLTKIFPKNKVDVRAQTTKDPQGKISNVSLIVTVHPNPEDRQPVKPIEVTYDMSLPGSNPIQVVENILPKIEDKVPKEPDDKPVTVDLQIRPPKGSTFEFVRNVKDNILSILKNKLPNNRIGLETRVTKDPTGTISNVGFIVTVHPKDPDTVTINLKQPGTNLVQNIVNIVPILRNKITREHPKGKPVNLEVNIEPPTGSTDHFVKSSVNTILTTLTKLFPNHKVGVQPQVTRDPNGNISNIKMKLTIQPNLNEPKGHVVIDLTKPGTNLVTELNNLMPVIETNVNHKEPRNEPLTFNLKVRPSRNLPESEIKPITNTILTSLTRNFPDNPVHIRTKICKNPDGTINDVENIVTIQPNNVTGTTRRPKDEKTVTLDISKPGSNIVNEITNILPNIKDDVDEKETKGEPVDYNLVITPPIGTTEQTVKITTQTILTTISKLFPKNKVAVTTRITRDPRGNIKTVELHVNIQPSTGTQNPFVEQVVTTPSGQTIWTNRPTTPSTLENIFGTTPSGQTIWTDRPGTTPSTLENIFGTTPSGQTIWTDRPGTTPSTLENIFGTTPSGQTIWTDRPGTTPSTLENIFGTTPSGQTIWTDRPGTTPSTLENIFGTTPSGQTIWTDRPGTTPSTFENIFGTTPSTLTFDDNITPKPQNILTFDLSRPGTTIEDHVTQVLPNIVPDVEKDLDQSKPVKLEFQLRPPVGTTTEEFVKTTTQSLVPILEKQFPKNKVTVTAKPQRDPQGNIIYIMMITVEPNEQQQPDRKDVNIDLDQPGVTIEDVLDKQLPNVVPDVKENLNRGKPTTISFDIRPPKGSRDNFLQITTQSLVPILKQQFPNNMIQIKTSAQKDPQGNLINMVIQITVEPAEQQKPEQENVDLDMNKPGTTVQGEVDEKLPTIKPNIENNLDQGRPVTIHFRVKPPTGSTQNYLQQITQSLVPILTKYFPSNGIQVKTSAQKNPQGFLIDINLDITIEPSDRQKPSQKTVVVDLSRPGTNVNTVVSTVFPPVIPDVKDKLNTGRPVSINFRVTPPTGSTESYIPQITQQIVPILQNYFPGNTVNIKTTSQKDPRGYLLTIILEIIVQPNEQQKPKEKTVDIDLSLPGVTLVSEVDRKLPAVLPDVQNNLIKGSPVTLNFHVKPPPRSSQDYLQRITQSLVPILSKYFPNNQVKIKTSANRDPRGFLIDMILEITILPSSQPGNVNVDVDLTRPGSTLTNQVNTLLPPVVSQVSNDLNSGKPVTLNFNIRPPNRSTQTYLTIITNQLTPILSKYFPTNAISIKTSAQKNPQGYLSDITLTITIQPSVTGDQPHEKTVILDLSRPGFTIVNQVNKVLPNVANNLKNVLNTGNPVTLNFQITPPNLSRDSYLQIITRQLTPILSKFFPSNTISIKTTAQKNLRGFLSNIVLTITIQPSGTTGTSQKTFDINLLIPGSSIVTQINKLIPSLISNVQSTINAGQVFTLTFNIQPPLGATQTFLQLATNQLMPVLSRFFPNYQLSVKTSAQKNFLGILSKVIVTITIQGSGGGVVAPSGGVTVNLDLSMPGINAATQVSQILPQVMGNVKGYLNGGQAATLSFKIKTPRFVKLIFVKNTADAIIPILSSMFPNNKIHIKADGNQDARGYVTEALIVITIYP